MQFHLVYSRLSAGCVKDSRQTAGSQEGGHGKGLERQDCKGLGVVRSHVPGNSTETICIKNAGQVVFLVPGVFGVEGRPVSSREDAGFPAIWRLEAGAILV